MGKSFLLWEEKYVNNPIEQIRLPFFHAVNFKYKGEDYGFAGWWVLYWGENGENDKIYDSKEEFLNDPIFDGRTFENALDDMTDFAFEYEEHDED